MRNATGSYLYVSPGVAGLDVPDSTALLYDQELLPRSEAATTETCALYLIGPPNEIISLEFTEFDIDCEDDGLLVVCLPFDIMLIS